MRASDKIKEVRSYTVHWTASKGWHVKGSHWAVGYTPAYCATPELALEYALHQQQTMIDGIIDRHIKPLEQMLADEREKINA